MKYKKLVIFLLTVLILPLMAEEVMKITLSSSLSNEKLSTLSKIVFTDNAMVAGASYNIDEIQKIEFYDDGNSVAIADNVNPHSSTSLLSLEQIGFSVTACNLLLTLPKASNLSVSLFSINGRKVAELFNGNANAGALNLNFSNENLATGVYSMVVKANNNLFVRKLVIK